MIIGDSSDGVEAALAADIVFDFFLCSSSLFEFLGVSIVPAGEPELRGRAMDSRVPIRVRSR